MNSLRRRIDMITYGREKTRGSWIVRSVAVLAAAVCLPIGIGRADGNEKEKTPVPVKKKTIKGESPRFDVIMHGKQLPKDKKKRSRPIALVLAFEDGSTQKIDISKHDVVTVDAVRQQVLLHSGVVTANFVPAPPKPDRCEFHWFSLSVRVW